MVENSRPTNKNFFQCYHNNIGYCKYRERCMYHHYKDTCQKSVCRDIECKFRHPKTCKHGEKCKFLKNKCCFYSHKIVISSTEDGLSKVKDAAKLENIVKDLEKEVLYLKNLVQEKEKKLNEIMDLEANIFDLKKENAYLLKKVKSDENMIARLDDKISSQNLIIQKIDQKISENNVEVETQNVEIQNSMNGDIETQYNTHSNRCRYCGKKFENDLILKEHIINHSGPNILNYKCSESEESDWETDDD